MLSVRLCLSSALRVLHRSFHGKCTGTDYHRLEREREREKGGVRGGRAWFCSQKMSSRVSSLQIPDYAHPYNCFTLSTDLFTLFIYSGIQQVSLSLLSILQNHFSSCAALQKKSFLCLNKQSNFSTRTIETTETDSFAWISSCTTNRSCAPSRCRIVTLCTSAVVDLHQDIPKENKFH